MTSFLPLTLLCTALPVEIERAMHIFELTRALIDIPSVTPEEEQVGRCLCTTISHASRPRIPAMSRNIEVEPRRFNVFARFGDPVVTLSTHMDTVPPFIPSREDDEFIWGRGACDTKGIIAAMINAAEALLEGGVARFRPALRGRRGAQQRGRVSRGARHPRGSRYIINGEPTGESTWRSAPKARCAMN